MAKQILDELRCESCHRKLGAHNNEHKRQPMYETAWSGLYWCGSPVCAYRIMCKECTRLSLKDSCNYE